jgi:putative CocE/NonD family hydrolase
LIVGPWTHARPSANSTKIGDVDFGPDAGFDSEGLIVRWFRHWLGPPPTPAPDWDGAPVRLFVMGENRWRDEQEWPLRRARLTDFFLHATTGANGLGGDGSLERTTPGRVQPDTFTYDPAKPVPTGLFGAYSRMPVDRREIQQRQDVLVYTSAPLTEPLEVTGPVRAVLWIASSATDTDFTAAISDVHPDGTARALTDGILRARYRASRTTPELLTPGQPYEITIEVGATSNVFLPGHRVRLEVSSSNFPRYDRNPNTGARFGTDGRTIVARQTVFHDRERPSRLVLPVIPR